MIETSKANYVTHLTNTFSDNPHKLCSHLSYLSKVNSMPLSFYENNSLISDPCEIAELFNRFFNSTFTTSDYILPDSDQFPSPALQLNTISTDESEVFEALSLLDHTKSPGDDRVNPLILKQCALSLTHPITHIINLSFTPSTFPTV